MVRQDAWNSDEDLTLAEVVLRHIREGSTQLAAFEEVGHKLSRTPAACGFRWNSAIRKKYDTAIQLAKKQRKTMKVKNSEPGVRFAEATENRTEADNGASKSVVEAFDEVITFLHEQKKCIETNGGVSEPEEFMEAIEALKQENAVLSQELAKMKDDYELIKNDYQLMINVVERAAKRNKTTASSPS
ncbi:RsfA family transcriptional regulator [Alteribacter keqinensis]|uniref:RsfA family transcriptional regulator n=1 Tax=Alteribacter keqinensis TaxID=2483800 RepID=A0A3M7TVM7_9BACI|nr:RsfA family transcriptional regulator [Alteribacter keqinensis]RNA69700.1 RsfA family transcriptional regulator [Alteribacter keqinensis]